MIWSAPAERSGDGALDGEQLFSDPKRCPTAALHAARGCDSVSFPKRLC